MVRAAQTTHNGQVETWYVFSSNGGQEYSVHFKRHPLIDHHIWTCNCMDFTERRQWSGDTCKHIDEVQNSFVQPTPYQRGEDKYGSHNWRLMSYTDARARREEFERKLESALESIKIVLEALRS